MFKSKYSYRAWESTDLTIVCTISSLIPKPVLFFKDQKTHVAIAISIYSHAVT